MTQPGEATPLRSAVELVERIQKIFHELPLGYFDQSVAIIQTALDNAYAAGAERMREEALRASPRRYAETHPGIGGAFYNIAVTDYENAIRKLPTAVQQVEPAGEK